LAQFAAQNPHALPRTALFGFINAVNSAGTSAVATTDKASAAAAPQQSGSQRYAQYTSQSSLTASATGAFAAAIPAADLLKACSALNDALAPFSIDSVVVSDVDEWAGDPALYDRMAAIFGALEEAVVAGHIRSYGVSSDRLSLPHTERLHISLHRLLQAAKAGQSAAPSAHCCPVRS
jgi:hypothetical protein